MTLCRASERGDREDVIVGTAEEVIKPKAADIVVVCTDSFTSKVFDKLKLVMENKMNVITSAEEMALSAGPGAGAWRKSWMKSPKQTAFPFWEPA